MASDTCKIFPPIGIARVGNAPDQFTIGPETYRGLPTLPDGTPFDETHFRDGEGRLCRQAALFHVFRRTEDGWEELTLDHPDVAAIEWTVHVANKKASWYRFVTNAGEHGYAPNHLLRNPDVGDRHSLVIDPGPRSIQGAQAGPVGLARDNAPAGYPVRFPPPKLYPGPADGPADGHTSIDTLGELRTDARGRLLFLGGRGISGSREAPPRIVEYANNDGWWDDTSDGPVHATVVLKSGERVDAGTAWVLVAPPAYAPEIANLVTLWDTMFDTLVRRGDHPALFQDGFWRRGPDGYRPSYRAEIRPLLERASLYPWVAAIPPKPHQFDLERLGRVPPPDNPAADENRGLRNWILDVLRAPQKENQIVSSTGRTMMPYLAGDNALQPDALTSKYLRLTDTQFFFLQQWADGWFVDEDVPTSEPEALTRAVLENCVGGAFSPGIEMSWNSRDASIYEPGPGVRMRAEWPVPAPLRLGFDPARLQPGDLSRTMAVPWQADFNECSSQPQDGRVLWWWPAQRPEFVYLEPEPEPEARRLGAAPPPPTQDLRQVAWIGNDFDQKGPDFISFADDLQMVRYWSGLGFVMSKEVPDTSQPAGTRRAFVEVARELPRPFFPPSD